MIRGLAIALTMQAMPVSAQDSSEPGFDGQLLEVCLENASLRAEQGDKRDAESCIGVASDACMETEGGYSTAGMNDCVSKELAMWDQYLNEAYNAVMAAAKQVDEGYVDEASSSNQAGLLKEMQVDWIAFRDATCAFERSEYHGGSMASNVGMGCLLDMTAKQALVLEGYRDASDNR